MTMKKRKLAFTSRPFIHTKSPMLPLLPRQSSLDEMNARSAQLRLGQTQSMHNTSSAIQTHLPATISTPKKQYISGKRSMHSKYPMSNKPLASNRFGKSRTPADCNVSTLAADILRALSTPRAVQGGSKLSVSRLKSTKLAVGSQKTAFS